MVASVRSVPRAATVVATKIRFFPSSGKSNQCPPPLGWSDGQCARYFEHIVRATRSPRVLKDEVARLRQPVWRCTVGPSAYEACLQECTRHVSAQEHFFKLMQEDRIQPTVRHYNNLLEGRGRKRDLKGVFRTLAEVKQAGLSPSSYTYRLLLLAAFRCQEHALVRKLMKYLRDERPDLLTETVLSAAVQTAPTVEKGREYLEMMTARGITVTSAHRLSLLSACLASLDAETASDIVRQEFGDGAPPCVPGSKLMQIHLARAEPEEARTVMRAMLRRPQKGVPRKERLDAAFYGLCVSGFAQAACAPRDEWAVEAEKAFQTFLEASYRNVSDWDVPVLALKAHYVRFSDVLGLHRLRVAVENEGYKNWTSEILAAARAAENRSGSSSRAPQSKLQQQEQEQSTAGNGGQGIPELAMTRTFSAGVTTPGTALPTAPQGRGLGQRAKQTRLVTPPAW
eukprot:Rhum_TRINITY_DN14408_c40_g1::Rhum_TRINITY_DN14408_c40_g1_i1::g.88718::m.88718